MKHTLNFNVDKEIDVFVHKKLVSNVETISSKETESSSTSGRRGTKVETKGQEIKEIRGLLINSLFSI